MDNFKDEIERLISKKKLTKGETNKKGKKTKTENSSTTNLTEKKNNIFISVEEIIASKEKSAKIAKQKRDSLKLSTSNIIKDEELKLIKKSVLNKELTQPLKTTSYITKKELINKLRLAKVHHKKQMAYIQILVSTGNFHDVKATYPINYTLCEFGKWFNSEGLILGSFEQYQKIEAVHEKVHDYYLQIYTQYKTEIKDANDATIKEQIIVRDKKIKLLWTILKEQSRLFFESILNLEEILKKLSDKEMDDLNLV